MNQEMVRILIFPLKMNNLFIKKWNQFFPLHFFLRYMFSNSIHLFSNSVYLDRMLFLASLWCDLPNDIIV